MPFPPAGVRLVALLLFLGAVTVDFFFHNDVALFLSTYPLAAVALCVIVALLLATALIALVTGALPFGKTFPQALKEPVAGSLPLFAVAALFFVTLLFRFAVLRLADLTPGRLVFVAVVAGLLAYWWLRSQATSADERKRELHITVTILTACLIVGLYLVAAASRFAAVDQVANVQRSAMGWALAYFAIWFLIGFLFGIPRVLQGEDNRQAKYAQRVNTNLEQISDWLTKIIVGLGLVQLQTVPEHLAKAATWMAQSFAPSAASTATVPSDAISFAGAFIIFFSVLGFFSGYLSTRLFLALAFFRADLEPDRTILERVNYAAVSGTVATGATGTVTTTPLPDAVEKLRKFSETSENRQKLEAWLAQKGKTGVLVADLINDPQYADLRTQALDDKTLGIA